MDEFWIDVGGTFTDCFHKQPDGTIARYKVLSSGVIKGQVGANSTRSQIFDEARRGESEQLLAAYTVSLLDQQGAVVAQSTIVRGGPLEGCVRLDPPLSCEPLPGQIYELSSGEPAPIVAIRRFLNRPLDQPIPSVMLRIGTTRGTNALLTRRGARTAFVTTRGFADILLIGYQNRPKLFELNIRKPAPLFSAVVEIDERLALDGTVLVTPDESLIREQLAGLLRDGIESLAICLLHSYAQPHHELLVERLAREVGFREVSVSHRVAPLVKIVSRGDTTTMDAYLNPILRSYVESLRAALPKSDIRVMTSAGGLVAADQFVGKDSILSGPAGGVVGFSRVAQAAGFNRTIGFDMGGTSTDVARFDGRYELEYETEKAGVRVVAPMMAIHTVAAGGGSICAFDGVKLVVGPDSAGADPGPACYGRGGPLAVTDINFYLGKILPEHFPFPLNRAAVERRLHDLVEQIVAATGKRYALDELCDGFLRVANSNMVKAIQSISVAKGCDPRDYVLVAFGGAGPQHACAVARELGMRQVLVHPDAGLLSAYGIGLADVVRHRVVGVYRPYSRAAVDELSATFNQLSIEEASEVRSEGVSDDRIEVRHHLDLRYRGLDAFLTIVEPADGDWQRAYEAEHEKLYGYVHRARPLEIVAARVEVIGHMIDVTPRAEALERRAVESAESVSATFDGQRCVASIYQRDELRPGDTLRGPAIIAEDNSTTLVDPGWTAEVLARHELLLVDGGRPTHATLSTECDPVMLEIFNNQFAGIAEQMGITLRNTSSSVNVKERLDFSCAIFTPRGDLVVNAPHIPVHLGAMSETVKRILRDNARINEHDVFVTNDPYRGGSHLPDVTVVTPVHESASGQLLFFTASRAHHAEIGGIRPGSMPPFSKTLAEEGVLIRNFKLVDAGVSREDALRQLLGSGAYPSRNVNDNLADIAAQVAANHQGARDLQRLVERYTLAVVQAYMRHIQDAAERKMRAALRRLAPGRREFSDHLDDGSLITVAVTIADDRITIDFTGTSGVSRGNLNANTAIVAAAVMYCLRALIDEDIPLNQGVLAPVALLVPPGLLNPPEGESPETSAAVVGGNVETSQRVVDVLLGALDLAAASQGTMNNTLFGDATFGYYETICGGAGATALADGCDAVHTHMTNTRLTDPEVIELRYPVRVREFSIRRGSGGAGLHRGGHGIVRRLEFLRPLEVSLLHQRRGPYAPYGLHGGGHGALGRNTLIRADGRYEVLSGQVQFHAEAGDVLMIETPGGGGYGSAAESSD